MPSSQPNRRQFLASAAPVLAGTAPGILLAQSGSKGSPEKGSPEKPGLAKDLEPTQAIPDVKIVLPTDGLIPDGGPRRLAAITGVFSRFSHADDIVSRFIEGYSIVGKSHQPFCKVTGLYIDKTPKDDIGTAIADHYNIPVYKTVADALTAGKGKELAVDGVLLIADEGDYPRNRAGQLENEQATLFNQIVETFRATNKRAPVFVNNALSWNWEKARGMYDLSKKERFSLMAGSSLPVTWRRPAFELRFGTKIRSALAVCGGAPPSGVETNGFHVLEALQSFVERRPGGETGVKAVKCFQDKDVWQAAKENLWDRTLLDAAVATFAEKVPGNIEEIDKDPGPTLFMIEYTDKFRAFCYISPKAFKDFGIAVRLADGVERPPIATSFYLPTPQRDHYSFLCNHIEKMFLTDLPSYPVERTLLTSGLLDYLIESRSGASQKVPTDKLKQINYRPPGE